MSEEIVDLGNLDKLVESYTKPFHGKKKSLPKNFSKKRVKIQQGLNVSVEKSSYIDDSVEETLFADETDIYFCKSSFINKSEKNNCGSSIENIISHRDKEDFNNKNVLSNTECGKFIEKNEKEKFNDPPEVILAEIHKEPESKGEIDKKEKGENSMKKENRFKKIGKKIKIAKLFLKKKEKKSSEKFLKSTKIKEKQNNDIESDVTEVSFESFEDKGKFGVKKKKLAFRNKNYLKDTIKTLTLDKIEEENEHENELDSIYEAHVAKCKAELEVILQHLNFVRDKMIQVTENTGKSSFCISS